jgi:hypothetical protein
MVKAEFEQQPNGEWDVLFFDKQQKQIGISAGYATEGEARSYAPNLAKSYLPMPPSKPDRK